MESCNPNKYRHLRDFRRCVGWGHAPATVAGCLRVPAQLFERVRTGGAGEGFAAVTARISMILDQCRPDGWSQSRALPTPIRRLGVLCEGTVRDPTRLAALARTTLAGVRSGRRHNRRGSAPTGHCGRRPPGEEPDGRLCVCVLRLDPGVLSLPSRFGRGRRGVGRVARASARSPGHPLRSCRRRPARRPCWPSWRWRCLRSAAPRPPASSGARPPRTRADHGATAPDAAEWPAPAGPRRCR